MKKNLLLVCLLLGSFAFAGNDVTVSKKITTSKDRCEGISQETFFNNAEGFYKHNNTTVPMQFDNCVIGGKKYTLEDDTVGFDIKFKNREEIKKLAEKIKRNNYTKVKFVPKKRIEIYQDSAGTSVDVKAQDLIFYK